MFLGKRWFKFICSVIFLIGFFVKFHPDYLLAQTSQDLAIPEVVLSPDDKILILAPHPDDEILGCSGIIQKAVSMKIPLRIVFFTYGDSNQWAFLVYRKRLVLIPRAIRKMGLIRHDEAVSADKVLGVSPEQLIFLGYPDFRTLNIWCTHWGNRPTVKGILSEVNKVPYSNAFRPGAPYKGEEILKDLETIIREFKPTKIFLSHPVDHHPDHQSLYLFTHIALWNIGRELNAELYPYLVHFKKWPKPQGYHPKQKLLPPGRFYNKIQWNICKLNPEEIGLKETALKKHRSQFKASAKYLNSFVRSNELFGDFPVVTLKENTPSAVISTEGKEDFTNGLTDEESAAFVGVRRQFVHSENNHLVISVELSRPMGKTVGVSVYVFGYREDRPFVEMPKLHFQFSSDRYAIFDQNREVSRKDIKITQKAQEIIFHIPFEVLGNPQKILTTTRTFIGRLPLDRGYWRILEISK